MAKKNVKERTAAIRDECDKIDADVEDRNAEVMGDPIVNIF